MNFPVINGVEEGSIVTVGFCIASGWFGNVKLWTQTVELPFLGEWTLNMWIASIVITFIYGYGATGLFKIFHAQDKPHFKKIYQRSTFISLIFFFVFGVFTQVTAMVYSSCEIWRTHNRATFYLFTF